MARYQFRIDYTLDGVKGVLAKGGGVTAETTVLVTAEEIDAAAEKNVKYEPPGS